MIYVIDSQCVNMAARVRNRKCNSV